MTQPPPGPRSFNIHNTIERFLLVEMLPQFFCLFFPHRVDNIQSSTIPSRLLRPTTDTSSNLDSAVFTLSHCTTSTAGFAVSHENRFNREVPLCPTTQTHVFSRTLGVHWSQRFQAPFSFDSTAGYQGRYPDWLTCWYLGLWLATLVWPCSTTSLVSVASIHPPLSPGGHVGTLRNLTLCFSISVLM